MAPEVQREAMVITKSQPKGKGHGGIFAFLRHLLRISLTHPMGLVKDHAQEEELVLQQQYSQMLERAGHSRTRSSPTSAVSTCSLEAGFLLISFV